MPNCSTGRRGKQSRSYATHPHAMQLPLALAVVRDPQMQHDRLYATSRRSAVMLCISAGYFLHVSVMFVQYALPVRAFARWRNLEGSCQGIHLCGSCNLSCPQDLYHCLTVFSEWGVPYLLHATLCCALYSYGAITGCLHLYGALCFACGCDECAQTLSMSRCMYMQK